MFLKRVQPLGMTPNTMKYQNYLSIVFRTVPKLLREYKNHITQYNPSTIDTNGAIFTAYKSFRLATCFQLVVAIETHKPSLFVDSIWMYIYLDIMFKEKLIIWWLPYYHYIWLRKYLLYCQGIYETSFIWDFLLYCWICEIYVNWNNMMH